MAVDTALKRFSMITMASDVQSLPVPSGTIDNPARQTLLLLYSGIASTPPVISDLPLYDTISISIGHLGF